MSLRIAKINDYWRGAYRRDYPTRLKSVSINNSQAISEFTATIGKGIIALVGGNGAGKSTLAHAIATGLISEEISLPSGQRNNRLTGSVLSMNLSSHGNDFTRRITFNSDRNNIEGAETIGCHWLDPSLFVTSCLQQIHTDANFEDVLDGLTPRTFSEDETKLISYIVGKSYQTCQVWEISEYGPFDIWPYFRASTGGGLYGSECMGQGELALFLSLWFVLRCRDDNLLVIEEPETHVSARSQQALMDFFAKESMQRGLTFIVTTHSATILQRIPKENILILTQNESSINVSENPKSHHILSLLGGGLSRKILIAVEDRLAKIFCETILNKKSPDLSRQILFMVCKNGESEIKRIIQTIPHVKGWGPIIGCFDGDQRTIHGNLSSSWPYIFLPTETPPEIILKNIITRSDIVAISNALHVDEGDLRIAISASDGLDHHDWTSRISGHLDIEEDGFVRVATGLWLRSNSTIVDEFISNLESAINNHPEDN